MCVDSGLLLKGAHLAKQCPLASGCGTHRPLLTPGQGSAHGCADLIRDLGEGPSPMTGFPL